jgi:hypothetical protein
LARQHVALLDHVMATIPSAGSAIKDPDRLRRLLSRPSLPVEWNLSVGPGLPPLAPYDESLVEKDPAARKASARALTADLLSYFEQLEHVEKVP